MEILYQYFPEYNFYIHKFTGTWSVEHYKNYMKNSQNHPPFQSGIKILSDFRTVTNWEVLFKSLQTFRQIRGELGFTNYKNVMLVDKPVPTALVHTYQGDKPSGIEYSYCSTVEHALSELELEGKFSPAELDQLISNLKNRF